MDHLIQIPQVGRAWEPIPEPWVTLGMLAGLEPGLRLGTLVTPVTFRAAGVLAKTVATLDALSGGRSFCGIGAGWRAREHAGFGLPFLPARPGSTNWSRPSRRFAPCGNPAPGNTGASGSASRKRPAIRDRPRRSRSSSAAAARSARCGSPPGSATAAIFPPTSAPWTESSPSCASTACRPGAIPGRSR